MIKNTLAALVLVLSGCLGTGLDTSSKQAVAFCSSFASTMQTMILLKQSGRLTITDIMRINNAVTIIEPFCTGAVPQDPTAVALNALDILLLIKLSEGS